MKLILWVLQGLLRLVALCVILYYTLICSIMIVRRGPRWWMRRSWDEVYDVQDRLNELVLGNLLEKQSKMKTVTIYTDGACSGNPGPGGWGAILMYGAHHKELSGGEANTTNNRMELTAVIAALSLLKEPCIVELWSDSKYVIDGLSKGWAAGWKKRGWIKSDKKPALNPDLWDRLLELTDIHTLITTGSRATRKMNIITAVMKWRWRRAGSGRESYFCGRGISCAGFPLVWEAEKESTNFPLLWKSRGAFLKNAADSGQFAGVFQEKYGWCGSFTNCSHQTHNSVKIIGYCIIKQRVLPTRCIFSLLKHTQQKGPPLAVLFVPSPLPHAGGFLRVFLVRGKKAVYNNG